MLYYIRLGAKKVDCYPDSAPVLQYGSGSSPDFMAKILGVDTQQFSWCYSGETGNDRIMQSLRLQWPGYVAQTGRQEMRAEVL
jgi:hypothetical protein